MRRPISALIISFNEEKHMARCLGSLTWADEILVVDAESTDRTREICKDPSAPWAAQLKLVIRPWKGFRDQRNFALREAKNDWVLVVDADEACTPELAARIDTLLSGPQEMLHRCYKVRRVEYFLGKEIQGGIWNPSYQDRFFHRAGVEYVNEIHEYPKFSVAPRILAEPLLHSPDFGPDLFLSKMNKYTTIEARDRVAAGRKTNLFRILFAFPAMFFKNFVYYQGYRDGRHGFVISCLEGVSRVVRHVKIWSFRSTVSPKTKA
ncbi:MAG TPA: glycosyltransferase family 2 protein [Bdellovibrionota bacterium]|nr:glycosyltransferase family 2 protein [Bdellovibrionota bacterium]